MLSFCGQTGFILGRKGYSYSCQHPVRLPSEKLSMKWYNPAIHTAAFQLPEFDKATLGIEENKEMAVLLEVVTYCDMSHSQQQIRMRLLRVSFICFVAYFVSPGRNCPRIEIVIKLLPSGSFTVIYYMRRARPR